MVYKLAQLDGVVPLSGTKDEEHMRQDVAVETSTINLVEADNYLATLKEYLWV